MLAVAQFRSGAILAGRWLGPHLSRVMAAVAITFAAIVGKLASGLAAGSPNKWLVGGGVEPRGDAGLIFAMVGREIGVLR